MNTSVIFIKDKIMSELDLDNCNACDMYALVLSGNITESEFQNWVDDIRQDRYDAGYSDGFDYGEVP